MEEFDENKAVKFMNDALQKAVGVTYDEDELINIIDIIWDWYDDNGFTDLDFGSDDDEDEEIDIHALVSHVRKMIAKDSDSPVAPAHIDTLVKAELDYENTLSCLS